MTQSHADLALLARGGVGGSVGTPNDTPDHAAPAAAVPMPRSRWRTRVLVPSILFGATALTLLLAAGRTLWPATPVRVVPVMMKAGVQAAGKVIVQAPGWVEADPYAVSVSALTDGVVEDVLVLEGQVVEPNEIVARLIDADARLGLARADAALQEAEAAVGSADADLKAAQREWDNPVELTRKVATAEAALAEKRAELARWPAELAAETALAEYKQAEFERVKPLYQTGTAASIEFVRAQKEYENQRAVAEMTQARKPIIEAQIASLEAEQTAAKENLRLRIDETKMLEAARAGAVRAKAALAVAQTGRDEAALRLDRTAVRSPVGGIVMSRLVEPGSKLMLNSNEMRSAQVVRLYNPEKLQVRVDVPLADAAKVGVGQPAEVVVDVLPERVFKGHVTRIVNEADVQKNTLQVKVAIEDPVADIKPEMLARARFISVTTAAPDAQAQRLFVPESVLMRHAGGHTMLWVADQARHTAVARTVTAGAAAEGWVEIESGVQPGDRVIVAAPDSLRDGGRIRIVGEIAGEPQPLSKGAMQHGSH